MPDTFTVTDQHLTLLRHANIRFNETFYHGSAEIDPKRPYKDGSAFWGAAHALDPDGVPTEDDEAADAYELAHWEEYMRLHRETATVIAIATRTGHFEPGTYQRTSPWIDDWKRIEPQRDEQAHR